MAPPPFIFWFIFYIIRDNTLTIPRPIPDFKPFPARFGQNEKDVLFSLCFVLHFNFIVKL